MWQKWREIVCRNQCIHWKLVTLGPYRLHHRGKSCNVNINVCPPIRGILSLHMGKGKGGEFKV